MKKCNDLFPFATITIDTNGFKINDVNEKFKKSFNINDDIIGNNLKSISFMKCIFEGVKKAYSTKEEVQYSGITILDKNNLNVIISSNENSIQIFMYEVKRKIENEVGFNEHLMENFPEIILEIDDKGKIRKVSDKAKRILGKEYTEKKIRNIKYYYDKENIKNINGKQLKFEDSTIYNILNNNAKIDKKIVTFKSREKYIKMKIYPIYKNQKLKGILLALKNVNEQYLKKKSMEDQRQKLLEFSAELKAKCDIIEILRNKEKQHLTHLKNIINNISEGLIVLDKNGDFSFCNRSAYNITKFDSVQIMNFFKLNNIEVDCDNIDKLIDKYHKNIKKGIPIKNFLLKFNDRNQYVEINSTPVIKNERIENTIITLKDITEIKIHQITAEEQSRFIKQVVNTVDIPIAVIKYPDETCKLINKKFEKVISKGKNLGYKECLLKYKNTKLYDKFKECAEKGTEITVPSYSITDEKGNTKIHRIRFVPYKNTDGKVTLVYIHGVDITDEIKHNKELENINKMKNEFFTVTSHELRTPLTIIYSSIQLAYDIYKQDITPNVDKTLMRINQNCKRLLKLVNNILDLSKAEAGYLDIKSTTNDIVQMTELITDSVNSYAQSKNITVIFDTNEEEGLVSIDKEKYEKILLNLLSNAIKFTPKEKNIYVTLNLTEDKFQLFVRDEGIGIPNNKVKYIFDRFTQVDNSLTRRAEGTGIGLSLVKKLVQLMEGTIEVRSKENYGTKFILTFKRNLNNIDNINCYEILDENVDKKIKIEFSDIE